MTTGKREKRAPTGKRVKKTLAKKRAKVTGFLLRQSGGRFEGVKVLPESSVEKPVRMRVTNSRPQAVSLVLEPWGEIIDMAAGAVYDIEAVGPDDDTLEVESGDDHITVYAWPGATISVYDNEGSEVGGNTASPRTRVPSSRAG